MAVRVASPLWGYASRSAIDIYSSNNGKTWPKVVVVAKPHSREATGKIGAKRISFTTTFIVMSYINREITCICFVLTICLFFLCELRSQWRSHRINKLYKANTNCILVFIVLIHSWASLTVRLRLTVMNYKTINKTRIHKERSDTLVASTIVYNFILLVTFGHEWLRH